jgi:hypothetical protein
LDFLYQVVLQQELQNPLIVLDQRTKGKGLKDKGYRISFSSAPLTFYLKQVFRTYRGGFEQA